MSRSLQLIRKKNVPKPIYDRRVQSEHHRHYDSGKVVLVNKGVVARPVSTSGVRLVASAKPLVKPSHIRDMPSSVPVIKLRPRMNNLPKANEAKVIVEGYGSCGRDCQARIKESYDFHMNNIRRMLASKNHHYKE